MALRNSEKDSEPKASWVPHLHFSLSLRPYQKFTLDPVAATKTVRKIQLSKSEDQIDSIQ